MIPTGLESSGNGDGFTGTAGGCRQGCLGEKLGEHGQGSPSVVCSLGLQAGSVPGNEASLEKH